MRDLMIGKLFVAASTAFLSVAGPANALDRLDVATSDSGASTAAAAIAFQLGFFEQAGLDVTLFNAGGGNNAVSTVVGGDAQIGIVGIRNGSKPVEKGQPLKVIGADTQGFSQYIVVRSDVLANSGLKAASTLAEKGALLRKLRIAVNDVGGSSGEFARYALNAAGYGDRDATIINLNSVAGRLTALKSGRIDGIVATPPEPETAAVGGYGSVLVDPSRDLPDLGKIASTVELVRADYLRQNLPVVRRYLKALERARALIRTDPVAAKTAYYDYCRTVSRGADIDTRVADLAWKNVLPFFSETLMVSREQYDHARAFFKIPASVTYEQFIDNSVAEGIAARPAGTPTR